MLLRLHFFQNVFYFLIWADNIGCPFGTHVFLSVHALFHPHLVSIDNFPVCVTQQRKWKPILFNKFLMTLRAIDADAKQFSL